MQEHFFSKTIYGKKNIIFILFVNKTTYNNQSRKYLMKTILGNFLKNLIYS